MTPARTSRTLLALAALVALSLLLPRRSSAQDAAPAAVPRPDKPATKNLDEWLAFVDGEFITRRMIQREIGDRAEEQSEADYERQVRGRLLRRVMTGVIVRKAKLLGLEIRPDQIDKHVEDAAKIEVEQAREREERRKPGAGANVTFAKILAERGQTLDEFKEMITREVLVQSYWGILVRGVPGKRPQFDPEPSPRDLQTLYNAHRDQFDQKQGVRLAVFLAAPESFLDEGKRTYEQSVDAARAHLEGILAEIGGGRKPEDVARARGIPKTEWNVIPEGKWIEAGARSASKAADEWAFDPARRKGDHAVFEGARGMLVGYMVLDVRPARKLTYEEVLPDLILFVRNVRIEKFRIQHMLESLVTSTIQPPDVVDELEGQLRDALKAMDEDPVKRDVRLR
jgi:hypothetical protein